MRHEPRWDFISTSGWWIPGEYDAGTSRKDCSLTEDLQGQVEGWKQTGYSVSDLLRKPPQ